MAAPSPTVVTMSNALPPLTPFLHAPHPAQIS